MDIIKMILYAIAIVVLIRIVSINLSDFFFG